MQALGGAKNHLTVMPDADLDQTTDALIGSAYGSARERCMAVSIAVIVGDTTADALLEKIKPRVEALKLAGYDDLSAEIGPLFTKAHLDKLTDYVDQGVADGANLLVDGRGQTPAKNPDGFFIGGCLFDNVKASMSIYKDEIFDSVLSVVRVGTYEQALALVNEHEFGNGAAILTRGGDTTRDFTTRARIGMIGVNVPITVPAAHHSFGGWKRSLFGDHHMHGPERVSFFTRLKTITQRWPSGIKEGAEFSIPVLSKF